MGIRLFETWRWIFAPTDQPDRNLWKGTYQVTKLAGGRTDQLRKEGRLFGFLLPALCRRVLLVRVRLWRLWDEPDLSGFQQLTTNGGLLLGLVKGLARFFHLETPEMLYP